MLVEIWSDVVCPWCAIGRAHLERALADFPHADEVEVVWRSFELDPHRAATTDVDYLTLLSGKYGTTREQAQEMVDRMVEAGAAAGVDFDFDRARPGNTLDAHRLLHLAAEQGRQDELKQRLLHGYHAQGAAIADHEALTRLAVEAGLDEEQVRAVLGSDRFTAEVRAEEQEAVDLGVRGVPFFVVDRRFGLSGAQPPEVLLDALRQAHAAAGADASDAPPGSGHDPDARDHDGHDHAADEACVDGVCAV